MYCKNCGTQNDDFANYCTECGNDLSKQRNTNTDDDPYARYQKPSQPYTSNHPPKSRILAGILGILIGGFGVHNFYLGYIGKGVAQLLLSTVGIIFIFGPFAAYVWGLVEGIMILTKSINVDGYGKPLID